MSDLVIPDPVPTGISASNVARLQALFNDLRVSRVLEESYTDPKPGVEWVIPSVEELLG